MAAHAVEATSVPTVSWLTQNAAEVVNPDNWWAEQRHEFGEDK